MVKDQFTVLWSAVIAACTQLAERAVEVADSRALDLSALYQPFDDKMLLTKVNSEAAGHLKTAWTPLVNINAARDAFQELVDVPRYSYLEFEKADEAAGGEEYEAAYAKVRDKVCEIQAVRSLARPETAENPRKKIVIAALGMIKELKGTAPAPLALLMTQAKGSAT